MSSNYATGVDQLILEAKENPAVPIVEKLLNRGDRLLIHGYEETYKSRFATELAHCIATGEPFLGELRVSKPLRVGIIETEMRNPGLGERLAKMFPDPSKVANIKYLNDAGLKALRAARDFAARVQVINDFLTGDACEVAIFDSSADLFAAGMSPDDERHVQQFFDELEKIKIARTQIHIRHDGKPKPGGEDQNTNNRTRGSSRWKELPETIVHFTKVANSPHAVQIAVGKFRYGRKPKPFNMRYDRAIHTVVPANPVLFLLRGGSMSMEQLKQEFRTRYGLGQRTLEAYLQEVRPYLDVTKEGQKNSYARKEELHPSFIWNCNDDEQDEV